MTTTTTETLLIKKKSWEKPDGTLFIYSVIPEDEFETVLVCHPRYRNFSIFSEVRLFVGEEVKVDLEIKNSSKGQQAWVKRVIQDFPKTPTKQWDFLERYAREQNAVRLLHLLEETGFLDRNECPIDQIIEQKVCIDENGDLYYDGDFVETILDGDLKLVDRYIRFRTALANSQDYSVFNELLGEPASCFTQNQAEKIINRFRSPEAAVEEIKRSLFHILSKDIEGIGFRTLDSVREKLAQRYPDDPRYGMDTDARVLFGAVSVLEEVIEKSGNTRISLTAFYDATVGQLNLPKEKIDELVKKGHVDPKDIDTFYANGQDIWSIVEAGGSVTAAKYWNAEALIYRRLSLWKKQAVSPLVSDYQEKLKAYLSNSDYKPSDEQRAFFDRLQTEKVSMIVGPGGTGKTKTVSEAIRFLKEEGVETVELLAPTGKAAKVLSGYAGYNARTIHKAYGFGLAKDARKQLLKNKKKPTVIFIDEFSMVDSPLFAFFLEAIWERDDTRIVLIGDEYQLVSVGPGNLLHTLIQKELLVTTRLTKSFRVKSTAGGIAQLSKEFREGRFTLSNNKNEVFTITKDFIAQNIDDDTRTLGRILSAYRLMLDHGVNPEEIAVLTPGNKGNLGQANINVLLQSLIREHRNADINDYYHTATIFGQETQFFEGDLVMFRTNRTYPTSEDANVFREMFSVDELEEVSQDNGDIGKIISISSSGVLVENLATKERAMVFKDEIGSELTLAYSYTIHKSQGSEVPYGILVIGRAHAYQTNANLLYTGITRFKEKCYLFGSFSVIRNKVRYFANKERETLLDFFVEREQDRETAVF